ncbi:hypothetical protein [Moorena sp. SIO3I6]|nr:hypothetical protein [Moorena sp. SIO3I6]NEP29120.1 hypothetical protein [Moorena sp. SIO3I6]
MTLTLTFSHATRTVTLRERSRYPNESRPLSRDYYANTSSVKFQVQTK